MSFWLSQKGSCVFGRWSTSFAPAGATSAMVNWLPPACTREPDQVQCWTRLPASTPHLRAAARDKSIQLANVAHCSGGLPRRFRL